MPQILAPAGDQAAMDAALEAGADAVYFGLSEGMNARARANNFSLATLPETVAKIHSFGAKAYLTLNTLVFETELPVVANMIAGAAWAGVDALIVQDFAVALLAKQICPQMEAHASTQMTIGCANSAKVAAELGITRIVVPRELSVTEIGQLATQTSLELEVFVHGALCVSWSGQCLTSEAWGGRSANRGQCAQSCRLPYELLVDGKPAPDHDPSYFLSPKDLCGIEHVPALAQSGVASLKIEGRYKDADYVASAVVNYGSAVDAYAANNPWSAAQVQSAADAMALRFSRGFSSGFLGGVNHQQLVDGDYSAHRGVHLGEVSRVVGDTMWLTVEPAQKKSIAEVLQPGTGVLIAPAKGQREDGEQSGGKVVDIRWQGSDVGISLFGKKYLPIDCVGQSVWANAPSKDFGFDRKARGGRLPVALKAAGTLGQPLTLVATCLGQQVTVVSQTVLGAANKAGLNQALLREKCGFGESRFSLAAIDTSQLAENLFLPVSELKTLRRKLASGLQEKLDQSRQVHEPVFTGGNAALDSAVVNLTRIVPLCRTEEQLAAALKFGATEVELDWMELVGLRRATEMAKAAGAKVILATTRIQKPGEDGFDRQLAKLSPDGILARNWGAVWRFCKGEFAGKFNVLGDFSLNVANSMAARFALQMGLSSLTFSHDLDVPQVQSLLAQTGGGAFTAVLHHHISTFHTEHCVYARNLSTGKDYRDCGRPCEKHRVSLGDRTGKVHPVLVDVGCRNTVFNASAQSVAFMVDRLRKVGVARYRVEFVWENAEEVTRTLAAYHDLFAGNCSPDQVVKTLAAHEQFGVTPGTMKVLSATKALPVVAQSLRVV